MRPYYLHCGECVCRALQCLTVLTAVWIASPVQVRAQDVHLSVPQLTLSGNPESGYFGRIADFSCDRFGTIYVLDGANRRIAHFDSLGKFIGAFGAFGQGPGEFDRPTAICAYDQGLLVLDKALGRVTQFNSSGELLRTYPIRLSGEDLVTDGETVYVSGFGGEVLLIRFTLGSDSDPVPLVRYDEVFKEKSNFPIRPALAITPSAVIVGLDAVGTLLKVGRDSGRPLTLLSLQSTVIDDYWRGFQARQEEALGAGRRLRPGAIRSVSIIEDRTALVEVGLGVGASYQGVAIAVDLDSGMDTGLHYYPPVGRSLGGQMVSPNLLGWIIGDDVSLQLFSVRSGPRRRPSP